MSIIQFLASPGDGITVTHPGVTAPGVGVVDNPNAAFGNKKPLRNFLLNILFDNFEAKINGGFTTRQIAWNKDADPNHHHNGNKQWCKTRHIVKPKFFGAPAPRAEMVSSDVHYRSNFEEKDHFMVNNAITIKKSIPIPGLAISVYCDEPTMEDVPGILTAHFFCREREAIHSAGNSGLTDDSANLLLNGRLHIENDRSKAAVFSAFVLRADQTEAVEIPGTFRFVHYNYDGVGFKNINITTPVVLKNGINHVYIGVLPLRDEDEGEDTDYRNAFFQNIIIESRNMHFELLYR